MSATDSPDSPERRAGPASDRDDPSEDEVLAEAANRRRKLWRMGAGLAVGIALGICLNPAAIVIRVRTGSWSNSRWSPTVAPAEPAAPMAATLVILATIGIYLWLLMRVSRCPVCERYVRRMLMTWNCPNCRARLR